MLVAICEGQYARGVEAPWTIPDYHRTPPQHTPTYDWREPAGSEANTERVVAAYTITHIDNALRDTHPHDAFLVTYVVNDPKGNPLAVQPRVNNSGIPWLLSTGHTLSVHILAADIDNPGHEPWSQHPELVAPTLTLLARLPTAGWYFSKAGIRILQPLTDPIPGEDAEAYIAAWHIDLQAAGFLPDPRARDRGRHFRLPRVTRDGRAITPLHEDYSRMRPIRVSPASVRASSTAGVRRADPVTFSDDIPLAWIERAPLMAQPFLIHGYKGERHEIALALAGALLRFGAPPASVPSLVRLIHDTGGDQELHDRETAARTTVSKWASGIPIKGYNHLPAAFRTAVDIAAGRLLPPTPAPDLPTSEESAQRIRAALSNPQDGVTLVQAPCGLGKSHLIRQEALNRARRVHTTEGPHTRLPARSKTAISVPLHKLSAQYLDRFRELGIEPVVYRGVASVTMPDGSPACVYIEQAKALASGGLSVRRNLCDGQGRPRLACEYRATCPAYPLTEGPEDARVAIAPHQLLPDLAGWAGSTGLLAIDEPPPILNAASFHELDLRQAEAALMLFEARYAACLAPALRAIADWMSTVPIPMASGSLAQALTNPSDPALMALANEHVPALDPEAAARQAFPEDHRGDAPPVLANVIIQARSSPSFAQRLGQAARILQTLHRAVIADPAYPPPVCRVDERAGMRVLLIHAPDTRVIKALRRVGPTVALDASAELHVAPFRRVLKDALHPLVDAPARDGCPVSRVHIEVRGCTRSRWSKAGRLDVPAIARRVAHVVDWALEVPGLLGIVSFQFVKIAIRAALGSPVSDQWTRLRLHEDDLAAVIVALRPILARLPQAPLLGHYGAVRGLDHWSHLSSLATIGDPWPEKLSAEQEAAWLGDPEAFETRYRCQAAAELEQSHGRLRVIHRHSRARMVHVGAVTPRGWTDHERRRAPDGRPRTVQAMTVEELRGVVEAVGGAYAAARVASVHRNSLYGYLRGEREVPVEVAERLQKAVPATTEQVRSELYKYPSPYKFHPMDICTTTFDDMYPDVDEEWLMVVPVPSASDGTISRSNGTTPHADRMRRLPGR